MSYQLPADLLDQIKGHIATGHFASEDEVLRAAMRALAFQNEELVAIQAGIDDMESGRLRPFEEVDAEIRQQFGFAVQR